MLGVPLQPISMTGSERMTLIRDQSKVNIAHREKKLGCGAHPAWLFFPLHPPSLTVGKMLCKSRIRHTLDSICLLYLADSFELSKELSCFFSIIRSIPFSDIILFFYFSKVASDRVTRPLASNIRYFPVATLQKSYSIKA